MAFSEFSVLPPDYWGYAVKGRLAAFPADFATAGGSWIPRVSPVDLAGNFIPFGGDLSSPVKSDFLGKAERKRRRIAEVRYYLPRVIHGGRSFRLVPPLKVNVYAEGCAIGAKRSTIKRFSAASRSRFQQKLEGYEDFGSRRGVKWRSFFTLTFRTFPNASGSYCHGFRLGLADSEGVQDLRRGYALLKSWVRSVDDFLCSRRCPNFVRWRKRRPLWAWKKEFQANGTLHFHLLCNASFNWRTKKNVSAIKRLEAMWARLTGNYSKNSVDLSPIKKAESAAWYMAKYISKTDKDSAGVRVRNPFCTSAPVAILRGGFVGRWWGFFNARDYKSIFRPARTFYLFSSFCSIYRSFSNLLGLKSSPDRPFRCLSYNKNRVIERDKVKINLWRVLVQRVAAEWRERSKDWEEFNLISWWERREMEEYGTPPPSSVWESLESPRSGLGLS